MILLSVSTLLFATAAFCLVLMAVSRPLFRDFANADQTRRETEAPFPPAAVILCVRGADPTLSVCLNGLLRQTWSDYEVHIVLDSSSDPGAELVQQAIENCSNPPRVTVHILRRPDVRRGLKVSAILQALEAVSSDVEVVAFLDADAEPDPFWLRNLARPLRDQTVGATSGLRWFAPDRGNAGSLIRAKWNLYALVLMRYCNIAWGGSLALRRDVLRSSKLKQRWAKTVCEDTCIGDTLAEAGLTVKQVPEVLMTNREHTSMIGCWRFMIRQLVFTRLHSQNWWQIVVFGLVFAGIAMAIPALALATLMASSVPGFVAVASSLSLLVYVVDHFEQTMQRFAEQHADCRSRLPEQHSNRLFPELVSNYVCRTSCILLSGLAIIRASFTRQLIWRGITYRVNRSRIHLEEYTPFSQTTESDEQLSRMSI